MISVLFHDEVGEKNPLMEQFIWDCLNGYGKYEADKALDLSTMFVNKKGSPEAKAANAKAKDCPETSANTSTEKGAVMGTVVKFD